MRKRYLPRILAGNVLATVLLLVVIFVRHYQWENADSDVVAGKDEISQEQNQENEEFPDENQAEGNNDEVIPEPSGPAFVFSDKSYFDDALLIGDSRMLGIKEYGNLDNADFFTETGLSVYKMWEHTISVKGVGDTTLEDLLKEKVYKKIYIMVGINELGYKQDVTAEEYQKTLSQIQQMEPEAIIYICANLHVTRERSENDELYNNENINQFNERIEAFADDERIFYLDVNEIFDDASGSLNAEYTNDGVHVRVKHYKEWVDWLCENTIQVDV